MELAFDLRGLAPPAELMKFYLKPRKEIICKPAAGRGYQAKPRKQRKRRSDAGKPRSGHIPSELMGEYRCLRRKCGADEAKRMIGDEVRKAGAE